MPPPLNKTKLVLNPENPHKKMSVGGWRDSSEIKSTGCFFRGPRFDSQHPHVGLQTSITSMQGNLTFSDRYRYQLYTQYTYIYAGKTFMDIKSNKS